ncbi:MAG: precorrin-3B C(17)-methyltransferase [Myxococcales bacterium]|nr:precorrin-3B C(17)-methyltransferase [Myxococcales bacterium]
MSRVGRLGGAILAETEGRYFLVGNLKQPCDFEAAGFEAPTQEITGLEPGYIELQAESEIRLSEPHLALELEGEALAQVLADRFIIARNGSVSERLWDLVMQPDDLLPPPEGPAVPARWLGEIPKEIFGIVRDQVLRCR